MGNNNSASFNTTHAPPPWTQSLPRDAHRRRKHAAGPPSHKVLPERIPGQRLRPTENGRNLQVQGTISHRKLAESVSVPNGYPPSQINNHHSTSMTALNYDGPITHPLPQVKLGYNKMSFTSEPDLREVPQSLPIYHKGMQQTIINESPIKGKIISKKRHQAPAPPMFEGQDYSVERTLSSPSPLPREDLSIATASPKYDGKSKSKKIGLFKKKSDARSKKPSEDAQIENKSLGLDRVRVTPIERVVLPHNHGKSRSKELRHRARSLDNLQHEVTRHRTTSENQVESHHRLSSPGPQEGRFELMERDNKHQMERQNSPPTPSSFEFGRSPAQKQKEYQAKMAQAETEWDKAEKEWVEKKKKSDHLQKEILTAAMNLRKIPTSPEPKAKNAEPEVEIVQQILPHQQTVFSSKEAQPKTFFFGMDPNSSPQKEPHSTTQEKSSTSVDGSHASERRSQGRATSKHRSVKAEDEVDKGDSKQISQRLDEFVATIERSKRKLKPNPDEYTNSLSRRGDGGYHSRQNSGSLPQDTENSGEEDSITMNLRPMIPRRQLDLPRFSPNAAWRSLGTETSGRSKDSYVESTIAEEYLAMGEDKIHKNARQIAPSRGSGEKSADSGISGDAGSPGLAHEFEPLSPKKTKHSTVIPLSSSSPAGNHRQDKKKAWTPAEDLDENSLDGSGDVIGSSPFPQEASTFPRLTSRTNMFSEEDAFLESQRILSTSEKDISKNRVHKESKRQDPSYRETGINQQNHTDAWRENWSMSRSIPNSLNTCEDQERQSNRSRSESRQSGKLATEHRSSSAARPTTPSYLQHGNSGHIMYLPEYKAYQVRKKTSDESGSHSANNDDSCYSSARGNTPEAERPRKYDPSDLDAAVPGYPLKDPRSAAMQGDKKKKFAYKSTIRIVEKKKLEEKLSREAQEMEERRLKEIDAMQKVEEEFQLKREREKKRLKKQLKLYQKDHATRKNSNEYYSSDNAPSNDSPGTYIPYSGRPSSPISPQLHRPVEPQYKPIPPELMAQNGSSENHGLFSGIKKWVKGKKESKTSTGYASDASSTTITSSRQDPDGAPSQSKKATGNFREEIIAAARTRNGSAMSNSPPTDRSQKTLSEASSEKSARSHRSYGPVERYIHNESHKMNPNYLPHHRRSPATSESSKRSSKRSYTPDSRRTISPDSRRMESFPLTQELPESRQEIRQYREYRQSSRKPHMSPMRVKQPDIYNGDNYRRNFVVGQMHNYPIRVYHDDVDQHSRHSNESRRSKRSLVDQRRPRDHSEYETRSLQRRPSSHQEFRAMPIDSSPARFAQNMLTPFHPSKAYRPVVFSASPHINVVGVQ